MIPDGLPAWRRVLAVVAHPDDESFGLGGVLDAFSRDGAALAVLCFTAGEASTLGATQDLAVTRAAELAAAADRLGVTSVRLRHHPDGGLAAVPRPELVDDIRRVARRTRAQGLLVFDPSGITGHPDHIAATRAALTAAATLDLPVLAWTLDAAVADALRAETGAPFTGHQPREVDLWIAVDRTRQRAASACHASQAGPDSVLWRRLELQGTREALRWLRRVEAVAS